MADHPWLAMLVIMLCAGSLLAQELPSFDLTQPEAQAAWQPTHDIGELSGTPDGLRIVINGGDPYTVGPTVPFPVDTPLWLHVKLKSDVGGRGQLFFAMPNFVAENAVGFDAPAGQWTEAAAPLPSLGPQATLRIDPPGIEGTCTIAKVWFTLRVNLAAPEWPAPEAPTLGPDALRVRSGELVLRHDPAKLGAFELTVAGRSIASGWGHPLLGSASERTLEWLDLSAGEVAITPSAEGLTAVSKVKDAGGATWQVTWKFTPAVVAGSIHAAVTLTVDQDRELAFAPLLMLFPGLGSFGGERDHGLFCGLEYLDRPDTSSSEADIIGPGSKRQVPDSTKISIPLMAIQDGGRYVGLAWTPQPDVAATFDSPDRLFGSGAHVMGLIAPGSNGLNRDEASLLPYGGLQLAAGQSIELAATLMGGRGDSVVPAVQHYVALHPLPDLPDPGLDKVGYARWAAGGWLDSGIRVEDEYKHAYWPNHTGFGPHPAADVPVFQRWLATQVDDPALAQRLRDAADAALAKVPPEQHAEASVSHVRYPVTPLLSHNAMLMVSRALSRGQGQLGRFEPDGRVLYKQAADKPDFGTTHFELDANGLTAQVVSSLLQAATLTADPDLIREGLRLLRALDRFHNSAPRGAQTWEVPLHTPDILASAYLVRAYVYGYELSGDEHFLDEARHWAWTGVPFVYLVAPTEHPVGLYATTAVYGATNWKAPNWMGLPVQWCGLVYADAIDRLARYDNGPWRKLADGIAVSGIQQSWPADAELLQALLPDSYSFRSERRNPVAINPGTVQAPAIRYYGGPAIYDYHVSLSNGLAIHAPGRIRVARDEPGAIDITVEGWSPESYDVLVVGLAPGFAATVGDQPVTDFTLPNGYDPERRALILRCRGQAIVTLRWP